jgi:multidrug resistance efflux pump
MSISTFPIQDDPDLRNSLNTFFRKTGSLSHSIYFSILGLLVLIMIGMAAIDVPVYKQARGIIRPSAEVNHILAPVQGIIQYINVTENQFVPKGFPVIFMESENEKLELSLLTNELENVRLWLKDLKKITYFTNESPLLLSEKYQIEYRLYFNQMNNIELKLTQANKDYQRFKKLHDEKFISKKELEDAELKYKFLNSERNQFTSEKLKQWNYEIIILKNRLLLLL